MSSIRNEYSFILLIRNMGRLYTFFNDNLNRTPATFCLIDDPYFIVYTRIKCSTTHY